MLRPSLPGALRAVLFTFLLLSTAAVLYATGLNSRTAQTLAESSLESTALALSTSAETARRAGGNRAEEEIRDLLDKNMMVLTKTDASGHYDLMVLMRSAAGVSYNTTDFTGDWMQHGVVSGNPNDTNWNFGQIIMDSAGQTTFSNIMGRRGAFSMQSASFAMNSSGVISMSGMGMGGGMTNQMMAQTYSGLMNTAKNLMVMTYSDGNGGYQLGIGMK